MNEAALTSYCNALWDGRTAVNSTLEEIAGYAAPNRQGFQSAPSEGDEGRDKIWDSTPEDAALTLSAALHGMLTNPATDWLSLELAGLDDDDTDAEAEEFLQDVNRKMLDVFSDPATGFQQEVNIFYMDLVFGWAVFLVTDRAGQGIRFRAVPPSQCAIAEDADGRVDTVLRRWLMTPAQMLDEFGREALSDQVIAALEGTNAQKTFSVSHLVAPRAKLPKDIQDDASGGRGAAPVPAGGNDSPRTPSSVAGAHAFLSVYYETESKRILRIGGYNELPYMVPRWSKRSGETYGRGPGHACLPDMRVLNRVAYSQLVGAEKLADPPMLVANDSVLGKLRTGAGGITTYNPQSATGNDIAQLPVNYKLDVAEVVMERRREAIRAAFLNDRIQMAGGPNMTATEVIARERKQNLVLGPVLGRLEAEFLGPLTARVFLIMYRAELFAVPESLRGQELRARYVSPIGRAQRQGDAEAWARAMQYLQPAIAADASVLDNFDFDAVARDSREVFGYPREYLRPDELVAKLRKQRAEAAQQQQALAAAAAAAKAGGTAA